MQTLFKVIKGNQIELEILLASFYGLSRTKVLGLRWSNIDFDSNSISIYRTVFHVQVYGIREIVARDKTKSSCRTLPIIENVKDVLLECKKKQETPIELCGNSYNYEFIDYLFVDKMRYIIKLYFITDTFRKTLLKNNIKRVRFHDLRHGSATLLYENGVPLKHIQEWLGHNSIFTTANIYTHFDFNQKIDTANAIKDLH